VHDEPQEDVLVLLSQFLPHWCVPALHWMPHVLPSHVADPFHGAVQGEQDEPQLSVLKLLTHAPPQTWKPSSQLMPHVSPSQVAAPFVGAGQGEHESPQLCGALFEAQ
jgi:hypothetical protein